MAKTLELLTDVWTPELNHPADRPGVLCEVFVYGNAINQTLPRGIQTVPVEVDAQGMCAHGPGGLEDVLANWDVKNGQRPRLMYTVTMGHNPTGGVLSVRRRREIYALCSKYDVIIVEDDPYWYLQYPSAAEAEAKSRSLPKPEPPTADRKGQKSSGYEFIDSLVPSYLSMDTDGRVIRLDTFSKTIAPGCRLGWITAQPAFIERLTRSAPPLRPLNNPHLTDLHRITEATTQQPSGFVQAQVAQLIMGTQAPETLTLFQSLTRKEQSTFTSWSTSGWVRWISGLRGEYERRMNRMCTILDAHSHMLKHKSPSAASALSDWGMVSKTQLLSFDYPRGGMFVWLRIHLESHPLYNAHFTSPPKKIIDGTSLSIALMFFLTKPPQLVLAAPGLMFGATDEIRASRAWAYFRLCFAAETDETVDAASVRFGRGVQRFFKIRDPDVIQELVDQWSSNGVDEEALEGVGDLGVWAGC